jgi:hypothetical protein
VGQVQQVLCELLRGDDGALSVRTFAGDYWLARATQVKNVWIPYGA